MFKEFNETDFKHINTKKLPEWLQVNNNGTYCASTIIGMNNRRQHGLFVVPFDRRHKIVLLSKFEETVFVENQAFEISTNEYVGGVYPDGYKYLKKFSIDPFPTFQYEVAHRKIEKTYVLLHENNTLLVRYRLLNQGKPVKIIIKPIMACRVENELTQNIQGINTDSYTTGHQVKIAPKSNYPELNIFFQKGEYTAAPLWYHKYYYANDIEDKHNKTEDLLNPGFFTVHLKAYETFELFISLDQWHDFEFESLYRYEKEYRFKLNPLFEKYPPYIKDISKKLEAFIPVKKEMPLNLQNVAQTRNSVRESIISQMGIMLIDKDNAKNFMQQIIQSLNNGLFEYTDRKTGQIHKISDADSGLLLINLGYYYFRLSNDLNFLQETLFDAFASIISGYQKGTSFNIYIDKDYLLFSGDKEHSTSWLRVFANKDKVRYGKLLEINALWYNALKIMEFFSEKLGKNRQAKRYAKFSENFKKKFLENFVSKRGYFYDALQLNDKIREFRITQIVPLGLSFSMIDKETGLHILDKIEKELYTPLGLRTLSKHDKHFIKQENISRNHPQYYDGIIFPWSVGIYCDAVLRYRGLNKETITALYKNLEHFKHIYTSKNLGFIPEIINEKKEEIIPGSLISQINYAEVFRSYLTLQRAEKKIKADKA